MLYKTLSDKSDPKELRRHEDRLKKRLQRFGYTLSKGKITEPFGKIQLKRRAYERGYQIINLATGAVEMGEQHDLTLAQVEAFWLQKDNERWMEKRKAKEAKAALRKRKGKELPKVETFPAVWW